MGGLRASAFRVAKIKRRLFQIIEAAQKGDTASKVFDLVIIFLIMLNIVAVMLETVESVYSRYFTTFRVIETVSIIIFTIEYLLRLWLITFKKEYRHPVWGRLKFALTPLAMVDLLAILPFYLPMVIPFDLRMLRAIRLFRLFRVFKMSRYSKTLRTLINVFNIVKEELALTLFVVIVLLIFASSAMYYAEHDAQPENFPSIPASMWWAIVTLTTVGYGDVYPVTPVGKVLAGFIALLGIGLVALPAGIIASGFEEEIRRQRRPKAVVCPKCGHKIKIK